MQTTSLEHEGDHGMVPPPPGSPAGHGCSALTSSVLAKRPFETNSCSMVARIRRARSLTALSATPPIASGWSTPRHPRLSGLLADERGSEWTCLRYPGKIETHIAVKAYVASKRFTESLGGSPCEEH